MFSFKIRRTVVAFVSLTCFVAGAHAQTTWYIDDDATLGGDGTTWETAYKHLQDALIGAPGGTEIRVAQGTYKPDQDEGGNVTSGERTETFQLLSGVALYGGYRGCLGGDCGGGNPGKHGPRGSDLTLSPLIINLTISRLECSFPGATGFFRRLAGSGPTPSARPVRVSSRTARGTSRGE